MKAILVIFSILAFSQASLAGAPKCTTQAFKAMSAYHLIIPRTEQVMRTALVKHYKEGKTTFSGYNDHLETFSIEGEPSPVEVYTYDDRDLQSITVRAIKADCEIINVSYENGAK